MSTITLNDGAGNEIARLDLGDTNTHGYVGGDLGASGGNLYIEVDGREYGSLFFHVKGGVMSVSLGQYTEESEEWEEMSELVRPVSAWGGDRPADTTSAEDAERAEFSEVGR